MTNKQWIIVGILALAAMAGFLFYFLALKDNKNLTQQNTAALDRINEFVKANDTLIAEKQVFQTQIAKNQKTIDEDKNTISDLRIQSLDLNNQIDNLKTVNACDISSDYTFDMSSQSAVSESLKEYIGNTSGKVITATWENVFTNTKTATHKLNTEGYLFVFIVDLKNPDPPRDPAIFNVGDFCFINPEQFK